MHIRDATPADFPAILALNHTFVAVLSSLDEARLAHLHAQAAQHRVIERNGEVLAFLLTLREAADYDSPNYRWFAARYPRFLYVDRIVVSASAQGLGAGRQLYRDAYQYALDHALPVLVCEYDIAPPNPASARFHTGLGFREVGAQTLGAGKQVSLQALEIAADTPLSRP
ncbi:GNAT family N-acetyltransferase [Dyella ginsengisoli]|uniref:GNAT family N-acetyltransferase n=1 Tax=Dyella ginsengisoli TaxID=363848 RepID=A0ABW8JT93_9GAMM